MIPGSNDRLNAATRAAMTEWNRVEPDRPISVVYVASWVDAVRAALTAADEYTAVQAETAGDAPDPDCTCTHSSAEHGHTGKCAHCGCLSYTASAADQDIADLRARMTPDSVCTCGHGYTRHEAAWGYERECQHGLCQCETYTRAPEPAHSDTGTEKRACVLPLTHDGACVYSAAVTAGALRITAPQQDPTPPEPGQYVTLDDWCVCDHRKYRHDTDGACQRGLCVCEKYTRADVQGYPTPDPGRAWCDDIRCPVIPAHWHHLIQRGIVPPPSHPPPPEDPPPSHPRDTAAPPTSNPRASRPGYTAHLTGCYRLSHARCNY